MRWTMVLSLTAVLAAGCKPKPAAEQEPADVAAAPAEDGLTTGGLDTGPPPTPFPEERARPPRYAAVPDEPAQPPATDEPPPAPVQPVRVNLLLTVDQGVDGHYVARFTGDFFERILKAMHSDDGQVPPIAIVDGKPAKYTISSGRSQLVLQVRADRTEQANQVLVSYRVTLQRPGQTTGMFVREGENLLWTLGETRAIMGKK